MLLQVSVIWFTGMAELLLLLKVNAMFEHVKSVCTCLCMKMYKIKKQTTAMGASGSAVSSIYFMTSTPNVDAIDR